MKLFPASTYPDTKLQPAQRDDELARTILIDAQRTSMTVVGRDGIRRPMTAIGSIALVHSGSWHLSRR